MVVAGGFAALRAALVVTAMSATIGHVTQERYDELVAECRDLMREHGRIQFRIGDLALEIEPIRPVGGSHPPRTEENLSLSEALTMFSDDVGAPLNSLLKWRWVSSRWPKEHRRANVSHSVHLVLAAVPDADQRFATIDEPPLIARTGERRWTMDEARRAVGHQVSRPETVQEKVTAVHDLIRDEEVASRVATDLLRRPEVAFKAMTDDTARHLVNRAQVDQARQGVEVVRQRTPALQHVEHTGEFIDLVGACAQFVASIGRIVPDLRGQNYTDDDRATVHRNIARVRAAADWVEGAVETGQVTPEEGLARLLRGE